MREPTFLYRPWFQFSLAVLIGILLGVIGPFGSFGRLGLEQRVFQWVILVALNWGLVLMAGQLVRALPWPTAPAGQGVAAALLAALPGAGITSALVGLWGWWPEQRALPFAEMLVYVAAINTAIAVPLRVLLHFRAPDAVPASQSPAMEPSDEAAFLRRLPPRLGRDLLAVEAEDHYLRVHTALGSDLILMRLSDAEAELAGLEGARTHRSWWVARAAVVRAERQGQIARLHLVNGMSVPVSRGNVAALKAAGWF